jgi:hypothetical protein
MARTATFTGGCLCGSVRYQCAGEPVAMVNCHCRDCQRAGGGAYSPTVVVHTRDLRLTAGEPKVHAVRADSGHEARRSFCPQCGSPLFASSSGRGEFTGIKAGSLDDPSWFEPQRDMWVASAQPWDCLDAAVPKIARDSRRPDDPRRHDDPPSR